MGSLCGCESKLLEMENQIQPAIGKIYIPQQHIQVPSFQKYQDIVPEDYSQTQNHQQQNKKDSDQHKHPFKDKIIIENQISLWKLNNQLSTLVYTFEQNNGKLGQTFSQMNQPLKENAELINANISIITGNNNKLQPNRNKVINNPSIRQSKVEQKSKLSSNSVFNAQNKIQKQQNEIRQKSHRIVTQLDEQSSDQQPQSGSEQNQMLFTRKTLCLYSQLGTDRIKIRDNFYQKYNVINGKLLENWEDERSMGIQINLMKFHEEIYREQSNYNQFNNLIFSVVGAINSYANSHGVKLLSSRKSIENQQYRLFINGTKRSFKIPKSNQSQKNLLNLLQFFKPNTNNSQILIHNSTKIKPCGFIYYLTGWIPQKIKLQQIGNIQGMIERISNNFKQGHTLISFTIHKHQTPIHYYLREINTTNNIIKLQNQAKTGSCDIKWEELVQYKSQISVNWNPSLYDFSLKIEGQLTTNSSKLRTQYTQYLLKIPPCKDDIELRIFLQIHQKTIPNFQSPLTTSFQLYDYHGHRIYNVSDAIRISNSMDIGNGLYSDVFIFEGAEEKTQYILVIVLTEQNNKQQSPRIKNQNYQYSLSIYSFNQIQVKQIPKYKITQSLTYETKITPDQAGCSINSPFFHKNLHFSITVPPLSLIQIIINTQQNHQYDINIIADPENCKQITSIPLENMLSQNYRSCQCEGYSGYQFMSSYQTYLIIIATYNQQNNPLSITLNHLVQRQQILNPLVQRQLNHLVQKHQSNDGQLEISELKFRQQCIYQQQIKWNESNPGPRKRLKSNSTPAFHPISVFEQFFKNPYLDKILPQGKYQFNIKSSTYYENFNKIQSTSDRIMLQPPSLSMGIMKISSNGKSFKIINDDAFYVPFGIGYWSPIIELEEANYRFIFPKIEKDKSQGIFTIRKINTQKLI